ncbi:iron-containing alcohol dehydrogenase [Microbacterium sp. RD1]|uniref:iron-containing alcohol dehydrogenase n=1 Tax=Microbacterium sp. RD1 TaxID=3457313 RepID=UPI003FA5E038
MSLIQYLARIQFGVGARATLAAEAEEAGIQRPLVISDPGLAGSGLLDTALASFDGRALPRFVDVPGNPPERVVHAALRVYRDRGCDGIVAVGGGSVLDTAKAVALLAEQGGRLEDYMARTGGSSRIRRIAPVVGVPTTAGTGSEIGRGAAITLDDGEKAVFLSPHLVPAAAVCDPELTIGLPPGLTAATGIDAFTHAFEAFLSSAYNPPADAIALDAIERLHRWLPRAVADGTDLQARTEVMMGATEAAMTTWKGLGATHALSMPFDDLGLHHGTLVGVLLPHTIDYLRDAAPADRLDRVARALSSTPDSLADDLARFTRSLRLPAGLAAMGVPEDFLDRAAEIAAGTAFNQTVPRPLSAAEYRALAGAAFA